VSRIVVDASVAIKWFLTEPQSAEALSVLDDPTTSLLAPDLIRSEVGQVLWKRWRQGLLQGGEALDILREFLVMPITIIASDDLIDAAWQLAARTGATVYDSLYLSAASHYDAVLLTADHPLALRATSAGIAVRTLLP